MKKVLLTVAIVAAFGVTSCGGDEDGAMDVCSCVKMGDEAAKEMKEAGDDADKVKEIEEKYKEKAEECKKMAEDMSEEDVKKAMEDCK